MKKKIMKALRDLNAYIDNDREKLSDRIEDLQLSHNRKVKLLKMCLSYLDGLPAGVYRDILVFRIEQELSNPYLRHNWKLKGGKHA